MKKATAELKVLVKARGSQLMDLRGVGPVVAARTLADVGDAEFRAGSGRRPGIGDPAARSARSHSQLKVHRLTMLHWPSTGEPAADVR